jgi:large subunit ribosomal protein L3
MSIEIMCRKLGMTQLFLESGEAVPVTVLAVDPNVVVQKKTSDGPDGYDAVQLAAIDKREKLVNKPEKGHFEKAGVAPKRHVKESRLTAEEVAELEVGQELGADVFEEGQRVDVIGTSKGRGFQGVVKRHGFAVKKRSHGTHEYFRHPGSIGAGANPGRVIKGQKHAGQMGGARVTTKNLEIVKLDADKSLIFVRGAVPGHNDGVVHVRKAVGTGH